MRLFALVSQALLISRIDAATPPRSPGDIPIDHLAQPRPTFTKGSHHSYDAVLKHDVDTAFSGYMWSKDAMQNARAFNAAMPGSRFRTLAEVIDTVVPDCGVTMTTGKSANVTRMKNMVWQNDRTHEGFRYHGPCEAWIDNTRVYQSPNCRSSHMEYPAKIPIDYSLCKGECVFKFYWLAVDKPEWRAYKQCVPITTRIKKKTQQFERPVAPKSAAPVIAKLDELRRKAVDSAEGGYVKYDSKPVERQSDYDDKKERQFYIDTKSYPRDSYDTSSPDRRDNHSDGKREAKSAEKDYRDGNDDRQEYSRHHHSYDDRYAVKPRDNSFRPMPSPMKTSNPTYTVRIDGNHDSADAKRGEMKDYGESKHSLGHSRRHSYPQDETAEAKPRTYRPTSAPTQSITHTREPLYLRRNNANDKLEDLSNEEKDSEYRHEHTPRLSIRDEANAPKARDDTRGKVLPPAYGFYPMNKSVVISLPFVPIEGQSPSRRANTEDGTVAVKKESKRHDKKGRDSSNSGDDNHASRSATQAEHRPQHQLQHHEAPRRTPQPPTDQPSLSLSESATQLHHEAPRRTPQRPGDHPAPILHVSAALPSRFEGSEVIQQHSAVQTPPPFVLQLSRVDHVVAL